MTLAEVFSGLPQQVRTTSLLLVLLFAIPFGLYLGIVVTPVAISAVEKGRSIKLGPIEIGEYEEPKVKQCKLVLQSINDDLRNLNEQIKNLVELKKTQDANVLTQITERTKFLQITQEEQNKPFYASKGVLDTMDNTISLLTAQSEITSNKLIDGVHGDVQFMNQVRTYCLNVVD